MGAGKPVDQYVRHFLGGDGKSVIRVVQDQDDAGRKHSRNWIAALRRAGLKPELVDPVEGKDAADTLAAGHKLGEAFRMCEVEIDADDADQALEDFEVFDHIERHDRLPVPIYAFPTWLREYIEGQSVALRCHPR